MTYSTASEGCAAVQPVELLATSATSSWEAILVDHVEGRESCEEFETSPTSDLTLVVAVGGRHRVEVRGGGRWRSATYEPGAAGMTAPGETARLRWEALGPSRRFQMAHAYLPWSIIEGAQEEYRKAGQRHNDHPLDSLVFDDPLVARLIRELLIAMRYGAPALYAEQAAAFLAVHLLAQRSPWLGLADDSRDPGMISDQRLARVIDYMTAHLEKSLSVAVLAGEAGMSVHHFARRFREQTGRTPSAYLTDIRFDLAGRLLRTTGMPIGEIALQCGYTQSAAFAASFHRRFGISPSGFRAKHRSATR